MTVTELPAEQATCCASCGCRLAKDQQGPTCSPCARVALLDRLAGLAPTTKVPLRDLRAAMVRGDLPALATAAGVSLAASADLAMALRLLPPRCRIPADVLRALVSSPEATNTALAQRFGVSRWAVAGWRSRLLGGAPSTHGDTSATKTTRVTISPTVAAGNRSMPPNAMPSPLDGHPGDRHPGDGRPAEALLAEALFVDALGPLVVRSVDGPLPLARQSRTVVSALALAYPSGMTIDALAGVLSPDQAPAAARRSVHAAVWRLRKSLPEPLVATVGNEYRLVLPAGGRLDVADFVEQARAAREALLDERFDDARAAAIDALARWRDSPVVIAPTLDERLAGLAELRDSVVEDLAQSLLRLAQPAEAAGRLRPLTERQPLRERAAALLIEAYRRLGQQADVAQAVERVEAALEEVGVEPGRPLRQAIDGARTGRQAVAPTAVPRTTAHDEVPPLPAWLRVAARGPFLGRDDELKALLDAIDPAIGVGRSGVPSARDGLQMVLVSGEAGAGKTRLVAEAATVARGRDLAVWAGRSDPYGAIPFAALVDALQRPLSDALEAADTDRTRAWMVEPVRTLLLGPVPDPPAAEAAMEQAALFAAVTDALRLATSRRRAVLILDDAQWASRATLRLLRHLVRAAPDLPLCLVVTWRHTLDLPPSTGELLSELAYLAPGQTLPLGGLNTEDIVGHPELPAGRDRRGIAERFRRLSGGNPLLLNELLARPQVDRLPAGLAAAIETRLADLDEPTRRALAAAAAVGAEFDVPTVRAVAGGDVDRAVDRAVRAGVVDLLPSGNGLTFRHDLLRTNLLDRLGPLERAELHLAVADVVDARSDRAEAPSAFVVAFQLRSARLVCPPERLAAAARRAGRLATAALDFDAAADWHETAASAAHSAGQSAVTDLLAAGAAWKNTGRPTEARRVLAQAGEAAVGPDELKAVAVTAAELDLALDGRLAPSTTTLLDRARQDHPAGPGPFAFYDAVADVAEGRLASRLTDGVELDAVTMERAFWFAFPEDRQPLAQALSERAEASGDRRAAAVAVLLEWIVSIESGQGHIDDPQRAAALDSAVQEVGDDPYLRWMRDSWTTARHVAGARLSKARKWSAETFERARRAPLTAAELTQVYATERGQIAMMRMLGHPGGRFEDVVVPIDRHWSYDPITWDRVVALALARAGRTAEARTWFDPSFEAAFEPGRAAISPVGSLSILSYVSDALGDRERAGRLMPRLEAQRGRVGVVRHIQILGPVHLFLGVALSQLDRWDESIAELEQAAAQAARMGMRTAEASTALFLCRTLLGRNGTGDVERARTVARDLLAWVEPDGLVAIAEPAAFLADR